MQYTIVRIRCLDNPTERFAQLNSLHTVCTTMFCSLMVLQKKQAIHGSKNTTFQQRGKRFPVGIGHLIKHPTNAKKGTAGTKIMSTLCRMPSCRQQIICTESLQTVTQLVLQYFLLLLPLGYQTTSPSCGRKWLLLLTLHWTVYELL